ncbi:hypothetical protein [Antribacter gilvus]|uniref:hypothetical protein n=1 Tax=Antribacter gilvus TaxID=2304675 RepID=UPI000F7809EF|nr:hypothetical protein [Antribacter gilvus]
MNDAAAVARHALATLGAPTGWKEPAGYPGSLALCAIDSVFSLRANYAGTVKVLDRYRAHRRAEGGDPASDGGRELLGSIAAAGGPAQAAESLFGNRSKAPGTKTRLKSEALAEAVARLADLGVTTTDGLRLGDLDAGSRAWRVRGLGFVSWTYLLMNAGVDGVKADTMVRRFVAQALGESGPVSVERAQAAVTGAAAELQATQKALDHAIWLFQRPGRKAT